MPSDKLVDKNERSMRVYSQTPTFPKPTGRIRHQLRPEDCAGDLLGMWETNAVAEDPRP